MNRLSRQLAASSRLFRSSNASVARNTAAYARTYAKKPPSPSNEPRTESAPSSEAIDQHLEIRQPSSNGPKRIRVDNVDELLQALESEAGAETIRKLPKYVTGEFNHLMSNVLLQNGEGDTRVMHAIADLLSSSSSKFKLEVTVPLPEIPTTENFLTPEESEVLRQIREGELDPRKINPDTLVELEAKSAAVEQEEQVINRPFPNLMSPDPLMDSREVLDLKPTVTNPFHNRVVVRNHRSIFHEAMAYDGFDFNNPNWRPAKSDLADEEIEEIERTGIQASYPLNNLMEYPLYARLIVQQTGKGKIKHFQMFTVVGDGEGMVGLGMGTDEEPSSANVKARISAMKNMDYVDRFENRTIWTEMSSKFRSTQIKMRPRPMGFGLRCQPLLHQILKAAGIKDISAKIWGSRNPMMIMQGALRMLQGGHNPLGFGDGIGGKGKRMHKGVGMRSKYNMERARGRKLRDFRK
ncbi:hypothetical protein D9757_005848 [Collybiopsis confluens]|uniref:S5 DRBM domain-containing protein n=1 Tax=Collybiopsis confluens TaxID=2823264 RepID=A0A8H5MAF6_9AGAR|nr:hypothetical protein D9757_005848 [Collybiopsis confluens]